MTPVKRLLLLCGTVAAPALAFAQMPFATGTAPEPSLGLAAQWTEVLSAAWRLPLATAMASVLALRPRRRGTPDRDMAVIHSQIILAVVGALVMIVVGSSLARAFGIVGAAGLVRYRAKIDDPKDAGVMLSTLAVGLAVGVGLWAPALFGTGFLLALLWVVESFEPRARRQMTVTVKAQDTQRLKEGVEGVLRRQSATFTVLTVSPEALAYDVQWPVDRPANRLSERLAALDPTGRLEVEIDLKK